MNYCQLLIAFLKIRINFQNWNICKSRNDNNNSKPSRAEKFFFFIYFLLLLLLLKCLLRNKQTKISAEATKIFCSAVFFGGGILLIMLYLKHFLSESMIAAITLNMRQYIEDWLFLVLPWFFYFILSFFSYSIFQFLSHSSQFF